jgi:pimeloyl-ACP methyl ester carboxylesterase
VVFYSKRFSSAFFASIAAEEQTRALVRIGKRKSRSGKLRVIKKILKYVGIAVALVVVLVVSSALLYRKYLQHKVAGERAITSPNGINSLEAVPIGGINQWIEVRGQNVDNPILLFIHGGPGVAFIPLSGAFQDPWEKYFTVVQWDQRGAGKTYARKSGELQRRTMTVPQMEQDTVEVANYLRNRFKREKIFVLGHSWGSILGLWLAHEHPEMVYAYVGVGQVINMKQNEQVAYHDALEEARKRHDDEALKALQSTAPYSDANTDMKKVGIAKNWESHLLGPAASLDEFLNVTRIVSTPEYSLADDYGFVRGQMDSPKIMLPEIMNVDLTKLGPGFGVPIFFLEGKQDPYCRPALVWEYSQTIKAPQMGFIWFDNSGHFPFFEEKQKFTDTLVQQVLPLAH